MYVKFLSIALVLVLCMGCTEDLGETDENVIEHKIKECKNVTYKKYECQHIGFEYEDRNLKKEDPYSMDVFCVGRASVDVKNLERKHGDFKVTFTFNTPIEGKVLKTSEKSLPSDTWTTFTAEFNFRCSQEYSVKFSVSPPLKEICREINLTKEECIVE